MSAAVVLPGGTTPVSATLAHWTTNYLQVLAVPLNIGNLASIHVVTVGTNYVVPMNGIQGSSTPGGTPPQGSAFLTATAGQTLGNGMQGLTIDLPSGYHLASVPLNEVIANPVSTVVVHVGSQWEAVFIQWQLALAYTNHGWYVVSVNVQPQALNQTPNNPNGTLVPAEHL